VARGDALAAMLVGPLVTDVSVVHPASQTCAKEEASVTGAAAARRDADKMADHCGTTFGGVTRTRRKCQTNNATATIPSVPVNPKHSTQRLPVWGCVRLCHSARRRMGGWANRPCGCLASWGIWQRMAGIQARQGLCRVGCVRSVCRWPGAMECCSELWAKGLPE
jgi:hypothetical protein